MEVQPMDQNQTLQKNVLSINALASQYALPNPKNNIILKK